MQSPFFRIGMKLISIQAIKIELKLEKSSGGKINLEIANFSLLKLL